MSLVIPHATPATGSGGEHAIRTLMRDLAATGGQPLRAIVTVGPEASDIRPLTVRVVTPKQQECRGLFLVAIVWGTSADGAPAGVPAAVTPTLGSLVSALGSHAALYMTDATGVLELDAQISGAATRHVRAFVIGAGLIYGPVSWL